MKKLSSLYPQVTTILYRALFLSAYLNLCWSYQKVHHDIKRLARITPNHLSPDPFYIERIEHGEPHYAGSCVLTAAHIIEVLSFPQKESRAHYHTKMIHVVIREALSQFRSSPKIIQEQLKQSLEKMKSHAKAIEIFLLPKIWYESLHQRHKNQFQETQILGFCTAHVFGWIGFSIYDAIIDGE